MSGNEKFFIVLWFFSFVLLVAFTLVTYETKNDYTMISQNLANANVEIVLLKGALVEERNVRKGHFRSLDGFLVKNSHKIAIVEESLDPKNTRWAKIKQVREAVRNTIEEFNYPKNMTTIQMTTYASAVIDYSEKYDVSVSLILAMSRRESAFSPKAKSFANAKGLIQIIPSTAREIAGDLGVRHYSMFKIRDNVKFGIYYIMKMLDEFDGDRALAVRAYNCGPTYVHKVLAGEYKDYPQETREYVRKILGDETTEGFIQYYEKMGL